MNTVSSYQIKKAGEIIGQADSDYGLYLALREIRLEIGKLAGVQVYDTNGTRLKVKQVADMLFDYAWNGKTA